MRKRAISLDMSDHLNICLISREYPPETGWGGIGTYTHQLAHGLVGAGHRVHVIAQGLQKDEDGMDGDVYLHRIAHRNIFYKRFALNDFILRLEYSHRVNEKINELLKKFAIDVIEGPNFSGEAFIYSLFRKIPLVTRLHTPFSEVIGLAGWNKSADLSLSCYLENATILRSDALLSSTNKHAEVISKEAGLFHGKINIIPLGVPLPKIDPDITNGLTVLYVGRLERRKGAHILIKSIPLVLRKVPGAIFNITGRDTFSTSNYMAFSGSKTESFKAKLLGDLPEEYRRNVNFLGHVEDERLSVCYSACDLFVAPSLYESFGLIYIEAMSRGKPVIGCRTGGVPEVVADQKTGLLVPPGDHVALADAIISLLKDKERREEMGKAARKHVEANFTREKMVEKTVEVYRRLCRRS